MGTYTIGEVARRSGFRASALRYYEGIGLLEPASRTEAGYRLYDDDTLVRLRFVARAKQLGCSLDEIVDLVGIWGGECGPVQHRLHELVTDKLSEAERQIAELAALTGQLRDVASRLAGPAVDGPCSPGCACIAIEATAAPPPIACTLGADEVPGRIEQLERLRGVLTGIERTAQALVLHFPRCPEVEADLRRFTVDEQACCRFWRFAVDTVDDELVLRWEGPPEAAELIDGFHAFLTAV